ncbi:MAG: hypothetical protein JWM09_1519 [Francisellaceae bacterium]|nr:hypothetical protein [Francisellaceae bacterium]
MMSNWFFLSLAILFEVIGTSTLKASGCFTKLMPSIIVIASYMIAFYSLSKTIRTIPVGMAYATWSGLGTILVTVIGIFYYKQRPDAAAILGILLIIAGVISLNLLSHTSSH